MPPALYDGLAARLTGDAPPLVARAHADWSRLELAPWLPVLRRHRVELRHHFRTRDSHDPALVAITVDALDLAASRAVDHLLLVGDVGAATPLVDRLRELGVPVTAVAPASTPHDFRAACTEFRDLTALAHAEGEPSGGRHRAT